MFNHFNQPKILWTVFYSFLWNCSDLSDGCVLKIVKRRLPNSIHNLLKTSPQDSSVNMTVTPSSSPVRVKNSPCLAASEKFVYFLKCLNFIGLLMYLFILRPISASVGHDNSLDEWAPAADGDVTRQELARLNAQVAEIVDYMQKCGLRPPTLVGAPSGEPCWRQIQYRLYFIIVQWISTVFLLKRIWQFGNRRTTRCIAAQIKQYGFSSSVVHYTPKIFSFWSWNFCATREQTERACSRCATSSRRAWRSADVLLTTDLCAERFVDLCI